MNTIKLSFPSSCPASSLCAFVSHACLVLIAGCHGSSGHASSATTKPSPVVLSRQVEPTFAQPREMRGARPVKAGTLPLVYLVESPATVRVVDATTGQSLGELPATARSLISIDERAGVRVAGNELRKGPLPGDHVYEIYATPVGSEENIYRTERTVPAR